MGIRLSRQFEQQLQLTTSSKGIEIGLTLWRDLIEVNYGKSDFFCKKNNYFTEETTYIIA